MKSFLLVIVLAVFTSSEPSRAAQVHASESPAPSTSEPPVPLDRSNTAPAAVDASNRAGGLNRSQVFRVEGLAAHTGGNGNQSRPITHGILPTGEAVGLHQSTQPAGAAPVALHVIHHAEFICVQQGEVAFDHEDDSGSVITESAGAGDVIYVANGTRHRVRNTGSTPARYFVVAIGGDAK